MEELIEYLKERQAEWLCILNEKYVTDGGNSLQEASKARLAAYTELLCWIEKQDKDKPSGSVPYKEDDSVDLSFK